MTPMLFAQVWHYWLALPFVLGAVLFVVAVIFGYLTKVVRPKYPPRGRS
jgi:hypothetical protein